MRTRLSSANHAPRRRGPAEGCGARPVRRPPSPATAAEALALQRSAGNRATVRAVAREPQLHLDPDVVQRILEEKLGGESLLDHLADVELPKDSDKPPPDPADPPGFEKPAREGSLGTLAGALKLQPQVKHALDNLEWETYGHLKDGDKTTVAVAGITLAAGSLGGLLATRKGRDLIGQLSGVELPVPKVPGLSFEFNLKSDQLVGLGVHVDVGELLGGRLGFGKARPQDPSNSLYGGR